MQAFRLHHDFKIDIPRFEQGKRASHLRDNGEGARPLGAESPAGGSRWVKEILVLGQHPKLLIPFDRDLLEELAELEGGRLSVVEGNGSFLPDDSTKYRTLELP